MNMSCICIICLMSHFSGPSNIRWYKSAIFPNSLCYYNLGFWHSLAVFLCPHRDWSKTSQCCLFHIFIFCLWCPPAKSLICGLVVFSPLCLQQAECGDLLLVPRDFGRRWGTGERREVESDHHRAGETLLFLPASSHCSWHDKRMLKRSGLDRQQSTGNYSAISPGSPLFSLCVCRMSFFSSPCLSQGIKRQCLKESGAWTGRTGNCM